VLHGWILVLSLGVLGQFVKLHLPLNDVLAVHSDMYLGDWGDGGRSRLW
jgi:hypothetical protein